MATADELLERQDEVRLVLCLDEAVVVVDEVLCVIERDTNNRVADDLLRRPTERLTVAEVDRAPRCDPAVVLAWDPADDGSDSVSAPPR